MNPIIEKLIKNRPVYVHAIEVETVYELQSVVASIFDTFSREGYEEKDIIDFILTLSIYYLGEDDNEEEEVYDFDIQSYIEEWI